MSDSLQVIVGVKGGMHSKPEREQLADCIESLGFSTKRANAHWPRDHFVRVADTYVVVREQGMCGEGGLIHLGPEYMLVSELLLRRSYFQCSEEDVRKDTSAVVARMNECYPGKRIHVVPVGCSDVGRKESYKNSYNYKNYKDYRFYCGVHGDRYEWHWHRHIDLTTLLIPSRRLLVVDANFYENEYYKSTIQSDPFEKFRCVAEEEGLALELFRPSEVESFWFFPLNCLVLPTQEAGETIVVNDCCPSLETVLQKYDVRIVKTRMYDTPKQLGSIRCCTNVCDATMQVDELIDKTD